MNEELMLRFRECLKSLPEHLEMCMEILNNSKDGKQYAKVIKEKADELASLLWKLKQSESKAV